MEEGDLAPLVAGGDPIKSSKRHAMEISLEAATQRSRIRVFNQLVLRTSAQVLCLFLAAAIALAGFQWEFFHEHGSLAEMCESVFNMSSEELVAEISAATYLCSEDVSKSRCLCRSTVVPEYPQGRQRSESFGEYWDRTTERNQKLATADHDGPYDVVLLGDSITEHWAGTDLESTRKPWKVVNEVFRSHFEKENGGQVDGLALGIGGDRVRAVFGSHLNMFLHLLTRFAHSKCGQLLYRLDNGELPPSLDAKVFWILIGTNGMGADGCSGESVAAGNIRIAEELRARRPNAQIVLNSLLPRGQLGASWLKDGSYPKAVILDKRLRCYAESTPGIHFFNATDLFLGGEDNTELIPEFYADGVHPSGEGSVMWAEGIVDKVLEISH